jgi:hypothetical protein
VKPIKVTIDSSVLKRIEKAAGDAVQDLAEHGLEESNRLVPIETGTLARTGQVSRQGLTATVSYDTPYAAVQHEDTQLAHAEGRQAKYLETAILQRVAPVFGDFVAQRLKGLS